jgi:type II secretory pathway predicted ATPase ExeA
MYEIWYKLTDKPFQISSDPKFLWLGPKHKEALATLKYGVLDATGVLLLTGDVGTGKTTLIHSLVQHLTHTVQYAIVSDPRLDHLDFFNYLATAYDLGRQFDTKGAFLETFEVFLNQVHRRGQKTLLVIDEAQALTLDLLEEIRLLSNLEKNNTKLIHILFAGQKEFRKTLQDKAALALKQRIALNVDLEPLTLEETALYIKHRLKVAGRSETIFKQDAVTEVFRFAQGYPRLTNIICDQALLTGFVKEMQTIDAGTVKECTIELIMAFPTDSDGMEPIPVVLPVPAEPGEKRRKKPRPERLRDARRDSRKGGKMIDGGVAPIPTDNMANRASRHRAADKKGGGGISAASSPSITSKKPPAESKKSSVKHIQIVYSRGKRTKAAPTAAASTISPPASREQEASQFRNTDLAQQVLKDLRKVTGKNYRKAMDDLNLARSSPIRMGLNRIFRNISNLEDMIDEINQTVDHIVTSGAMPKLRDLKNNGPTPFLVNLLDILWHEVARRYMKQRTLEAASKLRATENFHITDFPQIILGE